MRLNFLSRKPPAEIERPLPVGMAEFEEFANRIIAQAGQYADADSMKLVLATNIMHADAAKGALSDKFFIDRMRKAAANQVASQVFQDVKTRQAEAARAAQEALNKQAVEVTTVPEVVTDEQPQKN